MASPTETLLEAVAVTIELTGTTLSKPAARLFAEDLARYPEAQVLGALSRCRREVKGRLTIADVISRLEDGRPGPEEAWAMIPKDEQTTVVWTDEMRQASGVALALLAEGDAIAARMAFLERYRKLVAEARDRGAPVQWTVSLGHDPHQRESAIKEALAAGKLPFSYARALLPHLEAPQAMRAEADTLLERWCGERQPGSDDA